MSLWPLKSIVLMSQASVEFQRQSQELQFGTSVLKTPRTRTRKDRGQWLGMEMRRTCHSGFSVPVELLYRREGVKFLCVDTSDSIRASRWKF